MHYFIVVHFTWECLPKSISLRHPLSIQNLLYIQSPGLRTVQKQQHSTGVRQRERGVEITHPLPPLPSPPSTSSLIDEHSVKNFVGSYWLSQHISLNHATTLFFLCLLPICILAIYVPLHTVPPLPSLLLSFLPSLLPCFITPIYPCLSLPRFFFFSPPALRLRLLFFTLQSRQTWAREIKSDACLESKKDKTVYFQLSLSQPFGIHMSNVSATCMSWFKLKARVIYCRLYFSECVDG